MNPIHELQKKEEEKLDIASDILANARNELYFALRYLDTALSALHFQADPGCETLGTDGGFLYFNPDWLLNAFLNGKVRVNRLYLHEVLHCLFCHLWQGEKKDGFRWDLACDMAVESILDELYLPAVYRRPGAFRKECYRKMKEELKVLTAEGIYHQLEKIQEEETLARMAGEFRLDDHSRWLRDGKGNTARNRQKEWQDLREKMQTEMETLAKEAAGDSKSLLERIQVENRERYDYKEFLRKFSVLKEEMQVDPDSFDYIFYTYGLEHYGNMPLIEPLETKEIRKIEDFVIVIDTSMSCSGELVRQFLEETYSVLTQSETYFKKVNIHIIQCDDRVREDVAITSAEALKSYMERLTINGCGGTDFRPAFQYVDELVGKQRFSRLKGLLYFTDGRGIYPVKRPVYDSAFVFMERDFLDVDVPPWAMKIILSPEDLDRDVEEKG